MDLQISQTINERMENFLNTPGEPGDLHSILTHISQTALKLFEADNCFCFAFHPATGSLMEQDLTIINSQQPNNASPLVLDANLRTLTQYVLRRSPLVVEDINENNSTDELHRTVMHAHDIRSFAAIALRTRYRKQPLAVLYLNYLQKNAFNQRELQNLRPFALLAATLLAEAWLSWRYRAISRIGQEINHELSDVDNLFEHLRNRIGNIANSSDTLQLTVYSSQSDTWDIYREINGQKSILHNTIADEISRYVTLSGQQLFVKNLSKEITQLPFELNDPPPGTSHIGYKEAIIAVPLQLRDLTLGTLLLQHQQADTYNEEDLLTLQLLANHIALALNNIRLHNNLSQLDRTGQIITQQLESDEILQVTVENVRIATTADLAILFLFDHARGAFQLPPSVSGKLHAPDSLLRMAPTGSDDIATLMLHREEPLFVKQSSLIAEELLENPHTRTGNFEQREEIASTAAMPLRVNNETLGVLFVNFRRPQRFDAPQKLLIEGLGHYIAIALKNAQTFAQLHLRRAQELSTLQYVDRGLNRMLDLQSILDKILELAEQQIDATSAAITLYDAKKHEFRVGAAIGGDTEQQRMYTIPLDVHSITRWIMDHKQSVRSNNVLTEAPWRDIYFRTKPDTVSELDVPLLDGDELVGIINFEHTKEGAFTAYDQAFLETLAGHVVLAVKKAQTYENEKRLVQEAQLLNEISKEITSHLHFEHVFGLILEKATRLTKATQGMFILYDPESNILRVVDSRGMRDNLIGKTITFDQGIIGYVARTQKMVNIDPREEPWKDIFLDWVPDTRSELAIPMLAGTELRGVLNLESPELNHFNDRDVQLLKALADLAVVALQNAERYEQAEKEAKRFELLYQVGQELSEVSQKEEAHTSVHKIVEEHYPGSHVIIRCNEEECQPVAQDTPTVQGTQATSAMTVPIAFKKRNYGTLELYHHEANHFHKPDKQFIQGLSQQLASTLYRIQANQERQEIEKRATVAEAMSTIGQSAFELTHRLGNDLGLVPSYVEEVQSELELQCIQNHHISTKLDNIRHAAQTVLTLSKKLKSNLSDMKNRDQLVGDAASIPPGVLFVDAINAIPEIPQEIELCLEIDSDTPDVTVIPGLGADILRNLITNAIEAMPNGGKLTLRTRVIGRMVALEVNDTGIGIAEDAQKKIFDLFFTTKRSSGFGLWSAKRYALENHGDLTVESTPGSGSTFTLTLPRT
jgi:GAF domain-containing protein